jgi:DNA gyrase subunit A
MAKKKVSRTGLDIQALLANENIIQTDVTEEIENAMLTYAIKTIVDRAIPDIRDGLKPVHRRVLYAAWEKNYMPNKKYVKNALIVGDTMGSYHPHGDGSIYDVIVNMSQPWNYRYPLMDFQGNNGSVDSDAPAAMRYTEGRLDIKSLELLRDIEDKCVDFRPNYSDTTEEPEVLPALFPNFLCNGASGIATGYTTDIPSHQLGEVVDAIIEVLKNPNATVDDLMKHIKGPDFAGGAYLINNSKIRDLYETGKASLTFRSKYEIENNEENDNPQIIINQLPPDINKPKLVDQLYKLCITEKKIPRVVDVRDESKDNGIRIVVELHKTAIPDIVINELYEKTPLQKNNTYIMRAIVNQTPKVLSLKEIIEYYIEHRRDVVVRRTRFILSKTKDKLHIQEGLNLVTNNIKKAIDIIQNSNTDKEVKEQLMTTFGLSEVQVNEVLEIKLRHLTKLNKSDILKLIADLKTEIANYENILSGQLEIDKVIISELKALKNKFNDERRTILIDEINSQQSQVSTVTTSNEPIVVVLTSKNTIKQITVSAFEEMIKNKNLKERTEAFVQGLKCTMNDTFVIIFENGEYAKVDFSDIVGGLSGLETKSTIKSIVLYDDKSADKCIVAMTKKGLIKKVPMTGLKARYRRVAPLFEIADDKIIGVRVITMNENNIITLATKDGLVHRFFEKSFKETSAGGKGINGISLMDDNEVIDFDITDQTIDDDNRIILFVKHDDGTFGIKSMPLNEFKPKGRIAQGIKGIEYTKKQPGNVYGMIITKDDFFVTNSKGNVNNIKLASLPLYNRYNKPDKMNDEATVRKFFLE